MHRINTTDPSAKWQWACPTDDAHRAWRVVNGRFECRACSETYRHLRNLETGEKVPREEIELVGPEADHQGEFGRPTVK